MAAYEVAPDGRVIPPLNITQPAPFMDIKGFQWGTVSDDIHISPANPGHRSDTPPAEEQGLLVNEQPSSRAARDVASPPQTAALPEQLKNQLKIGETPESGGGPVFPLEQFQGAHVGNGFIMIFRPRKFPNAPPTFADFDGKIVTGSDGVDDNILQLNLTLEQVNFGAPIGNIPKRGFGK